MAFKRIQKELLLLSTNPDNLTYFHYESSEKVDNDSSEIYCMYGYLLPQIEPHSNGQYKVKITFSRDYPFKPPWIQLLVSIFHPNLQSDFFSQLYYHYCSTLSPIWSPALTLSGWINHFVDLIDHPVDIKDTCCTNFRAANLYKQNRTEYNKTVIEYIKRYAEIRSNHLIYSLKFISKQIIRRQLGFNAEKINQLSLTNNLKTYVNSL